MPVQSVDALEQAMLQFVHDPSLAAHAGDYRVVTVKEQYGVQGSTLPRGYVKSAAITGNWKFYVVTWPNHCKC